MATQITWIIEWMQCKPTEGSLTDVVITAGWRCNGTDGAYAATVYGTCSFPQPGDPFTPYADLTEQQVLGWCWANGCWPPSKGIQIRPLPGKPSSF